jgi:type IV pilus assembly protein PilE
MNTPRPGARGAGGFTLVELTMAAAVAAVLAAVALPSYRGHQLQAGRLDAVAALTRLQMAQERHRAAHGFYAGQLGALRGVDAVSADGRYTVALALVGAEGYHATATPRPEGPQAGDRDCPALTLDVVQGFARTGPSARCWRR